MVKVSCNNVLWEVHIGVSGQGDAPIGPSPLLKICKYVTNTPPLNRHHTVVEGFEYLNDSRSYVVQGDWSDYERFQCP